MNTTTDITMTASGPAVTYTGVPTYSYPANPELAPAAASEPAVQEVDDLSDRPSVLTNEDILPELIYEIDISNPEAPLAKVDFVPGEVGALPANPAVTFSHVPMPWSPVADTNPANDHIGADTTTTFVDSGGEVQPLSTLISATVNEVGARGVGVSEESVRRLADVLGKAVPARPKKTKAPKLTTTPTPTRAPIADPRLARLLGGLGQQAMNPEVNRHRPLVQEGIDHANIGTGAWYMRLLDLTSPAMAKRGHKAKDDAPRVVVPMQHSQFGEFACVAGLIAFLKDRATYDATGATPWAANWRELHGSRLRAAARKARDNGATVTMPGLQLIAAWFMWQRVSTTPALAAQLAATGELPITMYYVLDNAGGKQHQAFEAGWWIDVIREIRDVCIANQKGDSKVPEFAWLSENEAY